MHILSVNLNDEEYKAIEKYALLKGIIMSEALKEVFFQRIEDESDIKAFDEALANFEKDPVTYTNDEVMKEFGLK